MAVEAPISASVSPGRFRRIVGTLRGVHASLGRWYWFILVALVFISLHTFDHTMAAINNTSPFSETIIDDANTEGFVLWHGGLTVLDYTMTLVLLTMLYVRWPEPLPSASGWTPHPAASLRRLHRVLGRGYWFVIGALSAISLHTFDHLAAIAWNTSPLSDTFFANSVSHEGFLLWHSTLTITDYAMTVWLIHLVYVRWRAGARTGAPGSSGAAEAPEHVPG